MSELARPASWFREWGMEPVATLVDDSTEREFEVYCRGKDGALLIVGYAFGDDVVLLPSPAQEGSRDG